MRMAYDFNSLTKQAPEASNRDKFYTDFEDVDPNKLHQISELTEWMRTKGKGSDVREIIAQLFERTWLEGTKEGNANLEVAQARGNYETLSNRLSAIIHQIQNVTSGSPKGVYDNLAALKAAKPNGDSGIYVTKDNGHWYYYNGGWQDGGVYQSTSIDLKLKDFSPELLDMFNFNAKLVTFPVVENSFYSIVQKVPLPTDGAFRSEKIEVSAGELYYIDGYSFYDGRVIAFVDNDGNVIESHPSYSEIGVKVSGIFEVPQNATGLYLTCQNGKPLLLVKINDIYPKLGELAFLSKANLSGWDEIPIEIFKKIITTAFTKFTRS